MAYVTSTNFEDMLPAIENAIKSSSFIAIDTEFTGLHSSSNNKPNLFDSNEQRYAKLHSTVSKFIPCQFGLSLFTNDEKTNQYRAQTFIFYIRPYSVGSIDYCFSFQASCLQFLCDHQFDFNKFAFEGIPYLNYEEEEKLKEELSNKSNFAFYRSINEFALQNQCSPISSWLSTAKEGDEIELKKHKELPKYVSVKELNQKFESIWASVKDDYTIIVKKISKEQRKEYETKIEEEDNNVLMKYLGFGQIFRILVDSKKVIVGHNLMLDLLFVYHHFYRPLPKKYKEFKAKIHKLFPVIYDTKHIILSLKKEFDKLLDNSSANLSELFEAFKSPRLKLHTLYSPHICQVEGHAFTGNPHEAGYDAYATGYVFIQIAHMLVMKNVNVHIAHSVGWKEHVKAIDYYKNRINLIRARTHYMNLEASDPPSDRPQLLFVQTRNSKAVLQLTWVAVELSTYGSVDVMAISQHSALVAVGNYRCAKDILTAFYRHPDIVVTWYNVFFHSKPMRTFLWGVCALSGTLGVYLIFRTWRPR